MSPKGTIYKPFHMDINIIKLIFDVKISYLKYTFLLINHILFNFFFNFWHFNIITSLYKVHVKHTHNHKTLTFNSFPYAAKTSLISSPSPQLIVLNPILRSGSSFRPELTVNLLCRWLSEQELNEDEHSSTLWSE